jgi:hypothetical protein
MAKTKNKENPFKAGNVVYLAARGYRLNEPVIIDQRTVASTFGDDEVVLTEPTSRHRRRVKVADCFTSKHDALVGIKGSIQGDVEHLVDSLQAERDRLAFVEAAIAAEKGGAK